MNRLQRVVLGVCAMVLLTIPAQALVLTFDDVTTEEIDLIPDGYGGLNWENFWVIDKNSYLGTGYEYGCVSGDYVALNGWGEPAEVSSGDPFDFVGAYLTAAFSVGLNIEITGYIGGSQAYQQTVVVDPYGPTWFNFNFTGIDSLRFYSSGGSGGLHFVMDNMTINEAPTGVPDGGATALLLGLACLGLRFAKRG